MASIDTVVFDVGETLINEERSWRDWATWLGVGPDVLFAALGATIACGEDHRCAFEHVAPGFDLAMEQARREAALGPWRLTEEDLYPDTLSCVDRLQASGYAVGIAGNQPRELAVMLADLGFSVSFIASSEGLGVAKPSSAFFEKVASLAQCAPERIAYVGDRIDNDVLPAKAAGMFSVFLRRGPWGVLQHRFLQDPAADAVITTLDELPRAWS